MSLQPLRTLFFEDLSVGVTDYGNGHEQAGAGRRLVSL
jgi:hypothetical protein